MEPLGEIIARAFSDAKVPPNVAARMIGAEAQRFVGLADGTVSPTPSELEAIAQVFGTSVRDFQASPHRGSPSTVKAHACQRHIKD